MKCNTLLLACIMFSISLFAQKPCKLNGNVRTPQGELYNNVSMLIFDADSNLLENVAANNNGDYALSLEQNTPYIINVYSNTQLIKACTIELLNAENFYDFLIPYEVRNLNASKSLMSNTNVIQSKQIEKLPNNNPTSAVANRPGFYQKNADAPLRIASPNNQQVSYMIDGVRVNPNSNNVQLPIGSVEQIEVIR